MDVSTDILRYLEVKVEHQEATAEEVLALEYIRDRDKKVRQLTELLEIYGRHNEGCSAAFGDTYRCRCGWREVEAELNRGAAG